MTKREIPYTQVSRCYWCDRQATLEFDRTPEKWVLAPNWYEINGPGTHGEYCTRNCMIAALLRNV